MRANRIAVATLAAVGTFVLGGVVGIGQQAPTPGSNPAQGSQATVAAPLPLGYVGEAIYPSFEGWGPAKNGQNYILIGYYNRNKDQTIDIPIGPNNHIDPGGPDLLQPTHFEPGRAWGVFALPVPKEFGTKKYTWTLVANGKSAVVQYWINPPYWVDFYKNAAKGNTPPVIKFSENGPELTGPPLGIALNLTATVNQPLTLKLWAKDKPTMIPMHPPLQQEPLLTRTAVELRLRLVDAAAVPTLRTGISRPQRAARIRASAAAAVVADVATVRSLMSRSRGRCIAVPHPSNLPTT
jgi:hypothetical protein